MDLGAPELLIILIIVGLLFGANKLPGLARGMGSAVSEFKKGQSEGLNDAKKDEPKAVATTAVDTTTTAPVEPAPAADAKPADPAQ
jgi:sec-independent protein translocase protein TatA